jgi:hypothetical protein
MKQANIKVAVRIRPLLDDESKQGHTSTRIDINQEQRCVKYPQLLTFNLSLLNIIIDSVFMDKNQNNKTSQFDYVIDQ